MISFSLKECEAEVDKALASLLEAQHELKFLKGAGILMRPGTHAPDVVWHLDTSASTGDWHLCYYQLKYKEWESCWSVKIALSEASLLELDCDGDRMVLDLAKNGKASIFPAILRNLVLARISFGRMGLGMSWTFLEDLDNVTDCLLPWDLRCIIWSYLEVGDCGEI